MSLQNYRWTKHADERLMQRFLIGKSGRQTFISNFMTNGGHFIRKEVGNGMNVDLWQANDIVVVVNPESQTVITVYHLYQKEAEPTPEKADNRLSDEFLSDLAVQARLLKKRAVRSNVDEIQDLITELWDLATPLRNTHDEVVDKSFDLLYSKTTAFRKYLGKIKGYRQSADQIISKEGNFDEE